MTNILIDSSAWIDYFRFRDSNAGKLVADLLTEDRAVMTGPVMTELLRGLKTEKEERLLTQLLTILPYEEVGREDWEEAGGVLRRLRSKGITVPLTDALIATVAQRRGLQVLTLDQHFQHFEVQRMEIP